MRTAEALDVVIEIASRWGENAEEQYTRRAMPNDNDDRLIELVTKDNGTLDAADLDSLKEIRQAIDQLNRVQQQRGCDGHKPACTSGALTELCDITIIIDG